MSAPEGKSGAAAIDHGDTIRGALGWIQDSPGSAPDRDMHRAFDALGQLEAERDRYREALEAMLDLVDRHDRWCGYFKDAPGDSIINSAPRLARAALAAGEGDG